MVLKFINQQITTKEATKATYLFPESMISEQYRSIRTNLQFLNGLKKNQALLITSPNNNEGKSTTAVNLAISLTQQKERVLIIDANIKKPTVHKAFDLDNNYGLTNVLNGKITLDSAVLKTQVGRLEVLPSGPATFNSIELIGSKAMFELMKEAVLKYEYVLIDSPSILELSDTKILSNLCDGVVLVIKSEKTKTEKALEAKKVLELAKARVIGVVLNDKK